jgi:hypothetical protein
MSFTPNYFIQAQALLSVLQLSDLQTIQLENNANGNPIYVGKALDPTALTTDPSWSLIKLTYDSNNFLIHVGIPTTGAGYKYAWASRASYTYS